MTAISDWQRIFSHNELQKLYARSSRMLTEIRNTLPESQRKMVEEFAELKNRICDESAKIGFRVGLSFGVKLMTESFSNINIPFAPRTWG